MVGGCRREGREGATCQGVPGAPGAAEAAGISPGATARRAGFQALASSPRRGPVPGISRGHSSWQLKESKYSLVLGGQFSPKASPMHAVIPGRPRAGCPRKGESADASSAGLGRPRLLPCHLPVQMPIHTLSSEAEAGTPWPRSVWPPSDFIDKVLWDPAVPIHLHIVLEAE